MVVFQSLINIKYQSIVGTFQALDYKYYIYYRVIYGVFLNDKFVENSMKLSQIRTFQKVFIMKYCI